MSTLPAWAAGAARRARASPALVGLAALGATAGLSPFARGLYASSVWVPVGLGLLVAVTTVLVATPVSLPRRAIVAPAALAALALLSLASALWTDSIEQAVVEGNRLFLYATALTLIVVLLRSDRGAVVAFAAFTAGAVLVAGWILGGMLAGDETLFLSGRLHEPLGYINGQSNFFLLAFWPCLALAECRPGTSETEPADARASALAGLGQTGATLFAGLAVLGQSRGAVIAAALSLVMVLALLPGRLRRMVALLVSTACLAPAMPKLLDVYSQNATEPTMHEAAVALLLACAAAGTIWTLLVALERRGAAGVLRRPRRVVAIAITALAVLTATLVVASAGRVASFVDDQYGAFVALDETQGGASTSRLASGAGNRYDYWRVAVNTWRDNPVVGTGAGGYDKPYFAERSTKENIRQPHSLPLQVLAELGLAGALLLGAALLAVVAGARSRIRNGGREPMVVAALGVVLVWFVHTSVDWMHLLPGLTFVALLGAAVLMRRPGDADTEERGAERVRYAAGLGPARSRARRVASIIVVGVVIAIAAVSLSRQGLSQLYVQRAQDALGRDPERTLAEANRALSIDREAIAAYYAKAAALARFGDGDAAEQVLLDAARREPQDFVTWVLLGDLSVRRGELRAARSAYGRAARLNPRQPGLAELTADAR